MSLSNHSRSQSFFRRSAMFDTAARLFYRYVCKRSSTFTLAIVISAVFFERAYDEACEYIFETVNTGVCHYIL